MFLSDGWKDYELIDCGSGEKLERWGRYLLRRPDPQVIWLTEREDERWRKPNARYRRSSRGGGDWEFFDLPKQWRISYTLGSGTHGGKALLALSEEERRLSFQLKPFAFKHTGLFPEQAANWEWFSERILRERERREKRGDGRELEVLNLFAYTGGATLAAAKAGARVTHVDAAKGMVLWAKENADCSGLKDAGIRWLVDDCRKFVEREIRRGKRYDGIIMDPPSYGRGPKGEIWKLEEAIYPLIALCAKLLDSRSDFFLLNSYTTGLQPAVMQYMLSLLLKRKLGGRAEADEIGLPVTRSGLSLPCGCRALWYRDAEGSP